MGTYFSAIVLTIFIIVAAFLIALFFNNRAKLLKALGFASIGYMIIDCTLYYDFIFVYMIIAGLFIAMLTSDRKFVPWLMWIVVALEVMLQIFVLIRNDYIGYLEYMTSGLMRLMDIIFRMILILCILGFAIVTTIVRRKRIKACVVDKSNNDCYIAQRESRSGFADAGNILSAMSFIFSMIAVNFAMTDYYYGEGFFSDPVSTIMVVAIVLMFVCAIAAVILLSLAREYGYKEGVFSSILYVWSWIPTAVLIVITVVLFIIMGAASGDGATSKFNKKVYKVRDEKGELRTLNYSGEGNEAVDDKGDVWITDDGGKTFRKRDLYVYTDPNGKREYVRDPNGYDGAPPSALETKDGERFRYDRFGVLKEERLANYDDGSPREIIETHRVENSEARSAEISDADDAS